MIAERDGAAVVIGATGAVGGAIRERLRQDDVPVIAVARNARVLETLADADSGILACPADIGAEESASQIADACARSGGPIRAVIQAAGLPSGGSLQEIRPATLGELVELKLGGLLRAVRVVEDRMAEGGRIVAIGGHFGSEPTPRTCGAGITNAALANLIRQLADHYGPRGITAHLVAPGPLETERLRNIAAATAKEHGTDIDTVLSEYRGHSPLERLTTVREVAWAVTMLLQPEAQALHGATIALDSGSRRGLF